MPEPMLQLTGVQAAYGRSILALRGVSLTVARGAMVALLGANGAGKSTTLKAASRLLAPDGGQVTAGHITYDGRDSTHADAADLVADGLVQVLEGRRCFRHLTIQENLAMGAVSRQLTRRALQAEIEAIYALFPRLAVHRRSRAGYTSGGEQQMLAIGRALVARPRLLLLDEPSMGLAPQVVEEIFSTLQRLHRETGLTILFAEQSASLALDFAEYGYVLENGAVRAEGPASQLRARADVREMYLGGPREGRIASHRRPRRPEFALHD